MDLSNARTWATKEARLVLEQVKDRPLDYPIILKTAYGPSGRPHLGTACEIIRSAMVAKVLRQIQPRPVVVISFADNMDGMRKVAENLPNREILQQYLGYPLYKIPDPFGLEANFAEYSISRVGDFIQKLGYGSAEYMPTTEYSIKKMVDLSQNGEIIILRSSDLYENGLFDYLLLKILHKHREILEVILPTLGEERRSTYSPLMPISPKSGKVLEEGIIEYRESSIVFQENGEIFETEVNGRNYKAQWKVDFAMQWIGLKIDYEMAGKDISIGSTPLSAQICRILGGTPPPGMMYEMFLAADGTKISKTKGNGISIEDWFNYATPGTIRHFMFLNPTSAKRLDIAKMPAYIDAYCKDLEKFVENPDPENPIWYSEPMAKMPSDLESYDLAKISQNSGENSRKLSISEVPHLHANLALGLLQGLRPESLDTFVNFLKNKISGFNQTDLEIARTMFNFYRDHFAQQKTFAAPEWIKGYLARFVLSEDAQQMQTDLYSLGNQAVLDGAITSLKDWFQELYKIFFGHNSGPRLGSFFALYGLEASGKLLKKIIEE